MREEADERRRRRRDNPAVRGRNDDELKRGAARSPQFRFEVCVATTNTRGPRDDRCRGRGMYIDETNICVFDGGSGQRTAPGL